MKGERSELELMFDERWFSLIKGTGWQQADEIKDLPDAYIERINRLTYNRQLNSAITPIEKAAWKQFICVDLDQNGVKEALVLGGPGGVILHYAGGEVYMTVIYVRHFLCNVYENGICDQRGRQRGLRYEYFTKEIILTVPRGKKQNRHEKP